MSPRVSNDHEARPDHERFTTAADCAADAAIFRLDELQRRYSGVTAEVLLRALIEQEFCGRLAVVSSFGAESAVLLALIAEIDRGVPILFLDTGKLFGETLRYRDRLIAALGLTDVRTLHPRSEHLATGDADGMLWLNDPERCCALRKVVPLARELNRFDAWLSGRAIKGRPVPHSHCLKRMMSAGSRSTRLPAGHAVKSRLSLRPATCRGTR
jgi:hypothetical protein